MTTIASRRQCRNQFIHLQESMWKGIAQCDDSVTFGSACTKKHPAGMRPNRMPGQSRCLNDRPYPRITRSLDIQIAIACSRR
jgi:hypothetical protein